MVQFLQWTPGSGSSLKKTEPPEPSLTPDELVLLKKFVEFLKGGEVFPEIDRFLAFLLARGTSKLFCFIFSCSKKEIPSADDANFVAGNDEADKSDRLSLTA